MVKKMEVVKELEAISYGQVTRQKRGARERPSFADDVAGVEGQGPAGERLERLKAKRIREKLKAWLYVGAGLLSVWTGAVLSYLCPGVALKGAAAISGFVGASLMTLGFIGSVAFNSAILKRVAEIKREGESDD